MDLELDLTLNQLDDILTHIRRAKAFLHENPNEQAVTAARIYNLRPITLWSSLSRPEPTGIRGGQNKILQEHQKQAIHQFIRSLLAHGIEPSRQLVFNSICHLKHAQDSDFKAPSLEWFSKWWKDNQLYKIKSKLLAVVRLTAQDE
jgi:hypothetical protein